MKTSTKIRILLLILLFLAGLVFFGYKENYIEEKPISVLADSALPVITLSAYGRNINELAGYVDEMDLGYMRDSILPLSDDKIVRFTIGKTPARVSNMRYEIRPIDDSRQIEGAEITDLVTSGNVISGTFKLDNLINRGEEYFLIIHLTADGKPVNYYSRIIYSPASHVDECLAFAESFHDRSVDKEMALTLSMFMETDRSQDNETLQNVNIKSSMNQLSWADLDFVQDGDMYTEISEVSATSCEITFYYDIVRKGESAKETYRVKEFYRLRRGEDRVYLLNFRRTLEEKFMMAAFQGDDEFISLGIVDPNVNYKYNDIGTICAFVSDGDLYIYSRDDNTITKVFSFRGTDDRDSYRDYNIKILTIDGTGMMDFLVYGYMAAGDREGRVGMSLYHYDETSEEIEERIFVTSDRSGKVFSRDLGELLYENTYGEFFFIMDGALEKIGINTAKPSSVLTGLKEGSYSVSESGRFIAYMDEGQGNVIHLMDLNTGSSTDIRTSAGSRLYPLTFLQEDFVYGVSNVRDMEKFSLEGRPMHTVNIVDSSSPLDRILKKYNKDGYFVTGISVDGYTVYLDRASLDENGVWQEVKQDTIMNSQGEDMRSVKVVTEYDDIKQRVVSLELKPQTEEDAAVRRIRRSVSSLVKSLPEPVRLIEDGFLDYYYVYSGTDVIWAGSDASTAVLKAYDSMGQVVDGSLRTIWKRGRASYKNSINVSVGSFDEESSAQAKCLSAIINLEGENVEVGSLLLRGRSPENVLGSTLKDKIVLHLTGVSTEQVMYYINLGTPVYTCLGEDNPVLLVGYDNYNFTYYDPGTGTVRKIGLQDASKAAAEGGSDFIVYIR